MFSTTMHGCCTGVPWSVLRWSVRACLKPTEKKMWKYLRRESMLECCLGECTLHLSFPNCACLTVVCWLWLLSPMASMCATTTRVVRWCNRRQRAPTTDMPIKLIWFCYCNWSAKRKYEINKRVNYKEERHMIQSLLRREHGSCQF
jgi:hypothetical protein